MTQPPDHFWDFVENGDLAEFTQREAAVHRRVQIVYGLLCSEGPLIDIPKNCEGPPCGECHLQPGEVCDICGRQAALAPEQDT